MSFPDTAKASTSGPEAPPQRFPAHVMIEPSYACNLRCAMCPRHFDEVPQGLMKRELFDAEILPALGRFRYVSFVGWGEPTLNPNLPHFLGRAGESGAAAALVTNGTLLRGEMARGILEAGADMVCVSIDAGRAETYEGVRGRGQFETILDNTSKFSAMRRDVGAKTALGWVFVMMKTNLAELPLAVEKAARAGFDRFYAKHMESATARAELELALWNTGLARDLTPQEQALYEDTGGRAREACARLGLEFFLHPQRNAPEHTCLVQPLDNVFVDWEGYVSPCCYLNRLDMRPYQKDKPRASGVMGNLRAVRLLELIAGAEYSEFRRQWAAGQVPEACRGCLNVQRMRSTSPG